MATAGDKGSGGSGSSSSACGWSVGTGRLLSFIAGLLVMVVCGTGYAFGAYSSQLKAIAHLDQSGIDAVGSIGSIGGYLGPFASVLLVAFGPTRVLSMGAVLTFGGYGAMVMGVRGVWVMGVAGYGGCYFTANIGTNMLYYTALTINVKNLPPKRTGLVVAVLVSLYGISAAMFTFVYNSVFHSTDLAGYLLMCGICLSGAALLATPFILSYPHDDDDDRDTDAAGPRAHSGSESHGVTIGQSQPLLAPVAGSDDGSSPPTGTNGLHKRGRDGSSAHPTVTGTSSDGGGDGVVGVALLSGPSYRGSTEAERRQFSWMKAQFVRLYTNKWFVLISVIHMCGTGAGLMHINNLSNIVKAINGGVDDHDASTYVVSLLSFMNCTGRLVMGATDLVRVRRGAWLFGTLCVMACAHFVMSFYVTEISQLYGASVVIGLAYGSLWSVIPTICSESFGRNEFAYNWGWLTSASGIGSPSLNAVFGAVYDSHNLPGTTDCIGPHCYALSYLVTGCVSSFAALLTLLLLPRTEYGKKTAAELAAINAATAEPSLNSPNAHGAAGGLLPPSLAAGAPASSTLSSGFPPLHSAQSGARVTIAARPDHSDSDDSAVGGGLSAAPVPADSAL